MVTKTRHTDDIGWLMVQIGGIEYHHREKDRPITVSEKDYYLLLKSRLEVLENDHADE